MKSMNKWILTGVISAATVGLCAHAQDSGAPAKKGPHGDFKGPYAMFLEKFDSNKDGKIDASEKAAMPAEAQKHYDEFMAKVDTNKDGQIDTAEREAAMKAHHAEMLAKYDTNKDGKLDDSERAAMKADMEKRRAEHQGGKKEHQGGGKHGSLKGGTGNASETLPPAAQ